jgi:hypothetical protein
MEKFIYVFIHLLLPILLIFDFIIRKAKNKIGLIIRAVLYISIVYFLYLWGQWPLVGSYYLKYFMLLIISLFIGLVLFRIQYIKQLKPLGIWSNIKVSVTGILLLLLLFMNYNAYVGRYNPGGAIELSFPLRDGIFYIASGGSNKLINNHMRNFPNAQEFALDINKLGKYKGVSNKVLSTKNVDHYIFSDTVFCPCNGKIVEIEDNIRDNKSGSMNVSAKDGTGNFVNIHCEEDIFVFIPHFKQFSIMVSENMNVNEGTPLGLVGISGFSEEPHLHIQASKYSSDSTMIGIPILFNGKFLSRNELFIN